MSNFAETSLLRVASSTFEDLGFLFADRELSEAQRSAALEGAVSVSFTGAFEGRVEVRIFGGVLPVLAMNMLGEDEPPSPSVQCDALGEMANVICGNLLPQLAGSREIFRLSAPAPAAKETASPTVSAVFGLEQGRAEVLLFAEAVPGSEAAA